MAHTLPVRRAEVGWAKIGFPGRNRSVTQQRRTLLLCPVFCDRPMAAVPAVHSEKKLSGCANVRRRTRWPLSISCGPQPNSRAAPARLAMCNHVSLRRQQRPPPASASATVAGSGWAGKAATARRAACKKTELKGIRKQGGTCGRMGAAARLATDRTGTSVAYLHVSGAAGLVPPQAQVATTVYTNTRSHDRTHQQQRGIGSSQVP